MALSRWPSLFWRWSPVVVYAFFMSFLSSRPSLQIPGRLPDWAAHAAEFALLALLLWRAIAGGLRAKLGAGGALAIVASCALYGFADELHQAFVPGRFSSLLDVLADVMGSAAAILLLSLLNAAGRKSERGVHGERGDLSRSAAEPLLTLMGKPGCHLCDEAEQVLLAVRGEHPFAYEKLNIADDEGLLRKYGSEVPVVLLSGRKIFKYRVDPERLKRLLARARAEVA